MVEERKGRKGMKRNLQSSDFYPRNAGKVMISLHHLVAPRF